MEMRVARWRAPASAPAAVCAVVVVLVTVLITTVGDPVGPPAAAFTAPSAARSVSQHGPAPFGTCARGVVMRVTVADPVVSRGEAVRVEALVQNAGAVACHFAAGPRGRHNRTPYAMGICGVMGLEVVLPDGRAVWPGNELINCPLLVDVMLPARRSLRVVGQWDQEEGPNSGLPPSLPVGNYVLVVDGVFRFGITVR